MDETDQSSQPTAAELERARRKDALAQQVFALLAARQEGDRAAIDGNEAIDTLAFVIALIIEYSPNTMTPYDIQRAAEQVATNIHRMAHQARTVTDETGRHPIEMFGASNPVFDAKRCAARGSAGKATRLHHPGPEPGSRLSWLPTAGRLLRRT